MFSVLHSSYKADLNYTLGSRADHICVVAVKWSNTINIVILWSDLF